MAKKPTNPQVAKTTRLVITMDGPKVGKARLSAMDLAEIIRRTQQALKRVAQVLYGQSSIGKGRKRRDIEDLCELYFVGWEEGSAQGVVELATPPPQLSLFASLGEESLQTFLRGIEDLGKDSETTRVPAGFDAGVLGTLDDMGTVLDHGVDTIRFQPDSRLDAPAPVFSQTTRAVVRRFVTQPQVAGSVTKAGRLEMVSGHGELKGTLWEADGTRWTCYFKEEHLERMPEAWMRSVQVSGKVAEGGKSSDLDVETLLILDPAIGDEAPGYSAPGASPFWKSQPLDDLIRDQEVEPADDLEAIAALWPGEEGPEEVLRFVLSERRDRHQLEAIKGSQP